MARVSNSASIARLVVRELRSGNRLKPCDGCRKEKPTKWVGKQSLCTECRGENEGAEVTEAPDISPAGQQQLDAQRKRLAYRNGQVAKRAGRGLAESNPYSRGRQSHADFIAGWHGR